MLAVYFRGHGETLNHAFQRNRLEFVFLCTCLRKQKPLLLMRFRILAHEINDCACFENCLEQLSYSMYIEGLWKDILSPSKLSSPSSFPHRTLTYEVSLYMRPITPLHVFCKVFHHWLPGRFLVSHCVSSTPLPPQSTFHYWSIVTCWIQRGHPCLHLPVITVLNCRLFSLKPPKNRDHWLSAALLNGLEGVLAAATSSTILPLI